MSMAVWAGTVQTCYSVQRKPDKKIHFATVQCIVQCGGHRKISAFETTCRLIDVYEVLKTFCTVFQGRLFEKGAGRK